MANQKQFLDQAYGLDSPGRTREFYRDWAAPFCGGLASQRMIEAEALGRKQGSMVGNVARRIWGHVDTKAREFDDNCLIFRIFADQSGAI